MLPYVCMYVCMSTCYSAPSRFLLRGAHNYSADTESEFHAEAHEQLRAKDLPRVPTWRLEVDSNPQPSDCKASNIPLHKHAPHNKNETCLIIRKLSLNCTCHSFMYYFK